MATNFHLKLNGITGESQQDTFAATLAISTWSWGVSHGGSFHEGKGGSLGGKVTGGDISISREIDQASPTLAQYACLGKTIDSAVLTCTKDTDSAQLDYNVITLTMVGISSYATGVEGLKVTEHFTLHFQAMKIQYFTEQDSGGKDASFDMEYNFNSGKQSSSKV
jgi:type VI secretion system secreted protein Hcp